MSRAHVIITGTGRAGTTFLVRLLTHLGCDTGFDSRTMELLPATQAARIGAMNMFETARAGLEMDVRSPVAPYIVKTPFFCDWAEEVLASNIRIDHAIVPVRRFAAAAASRAYVQTTSAGSGNRVRKVPGGLWDVETADTQVDMLRLKFTRLIEALVRYDVPITFLAFPRLVRDPDYLHQKMRFLLKDIDVAAFRSAFASIVRPEWVHQFTADDS